VRWGQSRRRDPGEAAIVLALRAIGALVRHLDGTDIPDLLVCYRGAVFLLEVKEPAGPRGGTSRKGQRLRPGQNLFRQDAAQRGVTVHVVHDAGEALAAVGARPRGGER
jgi:hypothetical protein